VVYSRKVGDRTLTFIVSGMLWRDSLIMMDRETESLWSHVTGVAIRGPLVGKRLEAVPVARTTWKKWRAAHPSTLVLAKDEPVEGSAYEAYHTDPDRFGLSRSRRAIKTLPGKALVHGTLVDGSPVAIANDTLEKKGAQNAKVAGREIRFLRSPDGAIRAFEVESRQELAVTQAYWFAWIAFYPGTHLIE